jgi:hypothetical protein
MSVLVAKISQSPWPELAGWCDGEVSAHSADWVIWTEQDTGDGMRFACGEHLGAWVAAIWDRIDGNNDNPEEW